MEIGLDPMMIQKIKMIGRQIIAKDDAGHPGQSLDGNKEN